MALGRYTEPDDLLAQVQDGFGPALPKEIEVFVLVLFSLDTYAKLDSHSALDHYFAEEMTRRDSAVASAGIQVGPSPWTWRTPSPTQGGPRLLSDPSQLPPQFKKPKTPPPRTVVATTCTEMYMRHTSQDVMLTFSATWFKAPSCFLIYFHRFKNSSTAADFSIQCSAMATYP